MTVEERESDAMFAKRIKGTVRLRVAKQTQLDMSDVQAMLAQYEVSL